MNKFLKNIYKFVLLAALIMTTVIMVKGLEVHAEDGKTVRVSTAKEIKKAINNPDVGTIIFRTQAYIDVTIKANKDASSKFLIVDSPNANITNKAVFASIDIQSAKTFTESASGNKISLTGYFDDSLNGFTVSKNKKVESLTLNNFYYNPGYKLRKGAKVKELTIVKLDKDDTPFMVTLNSKNKTGKISIIDYWDFEEKFSFTIDKNGRLTRVICDSENVENYFDYKYEYDKNGNLLSVTGEDNGNGGCDYFTYSGNKLVNKKVGVFSVANTQYEYDKKGRLVHELSNYEYTMDNITEYETSDVDYEYDKKGRLTYYRFEYVESGYFYEYSYQYNSKGFLTKVYCNELGALSESTYEYNKAGDMLKFINVSEGYTDVIESKYDELGNIIN